MHSISGLMFVGLTGNSDSGHGLVEADSANARTHLILIGPDCRD